MTRCPWWYVGLRLLFEGPSDCACYACGAPTNKGEPSCRYCAAPFDWPKPAPPQPIQPPAVRASNHAPCVGAAAGFAVGGPPGAVFGWLLGSLW